MSWMLNALRSAVTPRLTPVEARVAAASTRIDEIASVIALDDEEFTLAPEEELTLAPEVDEPAPKLHGAELMAESSSEAPAFAATQADFTASEISVAQHSEAVVVVSETPLEQPPSVSQATPPDDEVPELESLLEAVMRLEEAARLGAPARRVAPEPAPAVAAAPEAKAAEPEPAPVPVPKQAKTEPAGQGEDAPELPVLEFVPFAVCSHPEVLESMAEDGYASSETLASQAFAADGPKTLSISVVPPGEWEDLPELALPEQKTTSGEPELGEAEAEAIVETLPAAPVTEIPCEVPETEIAPQLHREAQPLFARPGEEHTPKLSLDYRFREIAERSGLEPSPLEVELAALLDDPQQGPPLRRAAHSILLQIPTGTSRVILLTGIDDEPHTSHVAGALAMILATEERARTLLIDAQPAARRLSQGFGWEKSAGLAEALRGRQEASAVVVTTATDRLALAPYGSGAVERTDEAWETLLADLRHHRDFVVIDARADIARHLARFVEGIFLIVRRGQTDGDAAAKVVQDLRTAGGRVLGCVLTNAG